MPRGGLNDVILVILVGRLLGSALLFLSRFTTGVWALGDALLFLLRFSAAPVGIVRPRAARAALPRV